MPRRWLVALALGAAVASCADEPRPPPLAVWSEFLSDADVTARLPLLADRGADLYLAVPEARIGDASLAAVIRAADEAGVGVRAWLLLPEEDGYWANEHNAGAVRRAAERFADWRDAESLPVDWIVLDLEMSLERTRAVAAVIEERGSLAGLDQLKQGRDPAAFAASLAAYTALVEDLDARGLRVMAVTYPTVLDDLDDGDDDIQDQLDVPVRGVPYHEVSFMVYQSLIYELTGSWHDADIVHSYSLSAVEQYGERGTVALGIVGSAGIDPPSMSYPGPDELRADRAAAVAAGVSRVSVYSLDGVVQSANPNAWIDADVAPAIPAPTDADYLRKLIRSLLDS